MDDSNPLLRLRCVVNGGTYRSPEKPINVDNLVLDSVSAIVYSVNLKVLSLNRQRGRAMHRYLLRDVRVFYSMGAP